MYLKTATLGPLVLLFCSSCLWLWSAGCGVWPVAGPVCSVEKVRRRRPQLLSFVSSLN